MWKKNPEKKDFFESIFGNFGLIFLAGMIIAFITGSATGGVKLGIIALVLLLSFVLVHYWDKLGNPSRRKA